MVSGALALVACTPAVLFDGHEFVRQSVTQLTVSSQVHAGAEHQAAPFYLGTLWRDEPVPLVAAVFALWTLRKPHNREAVVVWAYAACYFGLIASQPVSFSRYLMPLEPALAILTGLAAVDLVDSLAARVRAAAASGVVADFSAPRPVRVAAMSTAPADSLAARRVRVAAMSAALAGFFTARRVRVAAIGAVLVGALAPPAVAATGVPTVLRQNPRYEAAAWIAAHVPRGAVVLVAQYGPWLDPGEYRVTPVNQAIANTLPGHVAAIVLTEAGARWLTDGAVPIGQFTAYVHLKATYCQRADFTDGAWIAILTPC
jgi:hypothetical protein